MNAFSKCFLPQLSYIGIPAVPLPDVRGRVQILNHFMKDVISSPGEFGRVLALNHGAHDTNADVDSMILARGTPGFSGADLQNMVK